MKINIARSLLILLTSSLLASCATGPAGRGNIAPEATALAKSVGEKLGAAQTIKLTATHKLDPRLGVGAAHEKGPLNISVQRPNRFYAIQHAGQETREIAYNGTELCLMHPQLKHHALELLRAASVEKFADLVAEKLGFRPPVAELLSTDVAAQLMMHVTSASVMNSELVGLTRCDRLHFEQEGMTGDLWVAKKDGLPRRYLLTFPGGRTWDILLTKWELNTPVDEALFNKRPAADSQKVQMLKSR
jgi:hypothetical protein